MYCCAAMARLRKVSREECAQGVEIEHAISIVFKAFTAPLLWLGKCVCCLAQHGVGNGRTLPSSDCKVDVMLASALSSLYVYFLTRLAYEVCRVHREFMGRFERRASRFREQIMDSLGY